MRMSLRFPIAVVLSIVPLAVPAWADYKAGEDAYNRGDYATAVHEWRPLAEQGELQVQPRPLYTKGQGVPRTMSSAAMVEKAASGDACAGEPGDVCKRTRGVRKIISRPCTGFVWPQNKEMQWR